MKILKNSFTALLIFICSSCALIVNDKKSAVYIDSNPPGAHIIIEGRNYGMTPTMLNLEVRPYEVSLLKEGYGSAKLNLDVWQGIDKNADGKRCLADMIGFIFIVTYYSALYSDECKIFKENEYSVEIPFTASKSVQNNPMTPPSNNYNNYNNQQYQENPYVRQGYGRSQRLPVY